MLEDEEKQEGWRVPMEVEGPVRLHVRRPKVPRGEPGLWAAGPAGTRTAPGGEGVRVVRGAVWAAGR